MLVDAELTHVCNTITQAAVCQTVKSHIAVFDVGYAFELAFDADIFV